ncbi:hypothetical protein KAR91_86935 [Candidatus Pacearchaeota archaeon]|nr:hypothetical protein [Candidatus Pacearchaeota archaeon]
MPSPTFSYVWVVYPSKGGDVEVYLKREKALEVIGKNGSIEVKQIQTGTNCWKYSTSSVSFSVRKQKVIDSNGL